MIDRQIDILIVISASQRHSFWTQKSVSLLSMIIGVSLVERDFEIETTQWCMFSEENGLCLPCRAEKKAEMDSEPPGQPLGQWRVQVWSEAHGEDGLGEGEGAGGQGERSGGGKHKHTNNNNPKSHISFSYLQHISARLKDNNKGIGFEGHDDTWLAHQSDFQSVLAALNIQHGDAGKEMSETEKKANLEELSKKSKKRVHYQKFVR